MASAFREQLDAARHDCRQRDGACRAAEREVVEAEAALARVQRRAVAPPRIRPEQHFGEDRWRSFDQEVKAELLGRLFQLHPDRPNYEAHQRHVDEAKRSLERARSWHSYTLGERTAVVNRYLALRATIVRELQRFLTAPVPEAAVTEKDLTSYSWTDPLEGYCLSYEQQYNRLKWYEDHNLPAPPDKPDLGPVHRQDDSFRVGYTAREQWERKRRPWL
jgi:hypothetical protein